MLTHGFVFILGTRGKAFMHFLLGQQDMPRVKVEKSISGMNCRSFTRHPQDPNLLLATYDMKEKKDG